MSDEDDRHGQTNQETPEPPAIVPFDAAAAASHPPRSSNRPVDPRLQLLIDRWGVLPEEVKQAIADAVTEQG